MPSESVIQLTEAIDRKGERDDPYDGGADAISGREAFAIVGATGSPTSAAMLPVINETQIPFIGTYSGADHLYESPPDRVVWQLRPRYEEETYRLTQYLVDVRDPGRVPETNVFALSQSPLSGTECSGCVNDVEGGAGVAAEAATDGQTALDAFGLAGYSGVRRSLQEHGVSQVDIPLATYRANSTDLQVAVNYFSHWVSGLAEGAHSPRVDGNGELHIGIVITSVGLAGAEFIERVLDEADQLRQGQRPSGLTDAEWDTVDPAWKEALTSIEIVFTTLSAAGDGVAATLSNGNPERLCGTYPIIISQVVPLPFGDSSAALLYREELERFDPSVKPGFASFEGWAVGKMWAELVRRMALRGEISSDSLIEVLERDFTDVELGIGMTLDFHEDDLMGSDTIFGTRLDETCGYEAYNLGFGG